MNPLRHLPIKRKLTIITLLTCGVTLVVAGLALAAYEQISFRKRLVNDLASTAAMIGANCTAGLTFEDAAAVEQTLKSLAVQPHVVRACVYDQTGRPFASYQHEAQTRSLLAPPLRPDGHHFTSVSLELFQSIRLDGEKIGVIFLETNLQEISSSLWRFLLVLVVLLLACTGIAWLVATRLQRIISGPVADLAAAAAQVAQEGDYSVRVQKQSDDELGQLTEGFNHMLAQIQAKDAALHKSHLELERNVQERTQQLADSLALTRATLEATTDGILVADGQGRVTGCNEKFLDLWDIPREFGQPEEADNMMAIAMSRLKDSAAFHDRLNELSADPETESFDVLEFKDGRVLERFSKPQRVGDKCVGRVWSFRDVTERKRSEAELAKLNRDLLETSRRAGMAEVATGVLHNVGNVLNSVNVAATCIADQFQKSKVANLNRVVALLRENEARLPEYLTTDPRGQKLLPYLGQLAEHIGGEQTIAAQELAELRKHIEHIKDIVVMQQNFARVSGVTEPVHVPDLLEEAVRLNESSFQRHAIKIIRDFAAAPVITIEKHKVLQILINLMRNAKQACDPIERDKRQITLRVMSEAGRVAITVADNGIGIQPENLTRIFSHGFTTKKNGHGFGLHSGALAAKEMGGALRVASGGPGQGAAFTLELPLTPLLRST